MIARCFLTGIALTSLLLFSPANSKSSDIHIVVKDKVSREKIKNALVTIYVYSEKKMNWNLKFYEFTGADGSLTLLDLEDWKKYILMVEAKGYMTYFYKDRFYFQTPDILEIGNYGLKLDLELIPLESGK